MIPRLCQRAAFLKAALFLCRFLKQGLLDAAVVLREGEIESSPMAKFAFGPDTAAVTLDDVFYDRQA